MEPQQLATAFTVWAAVVALIGAALVFELARLRGEMKAMADLLRDHMLMTERRLTAVETHLEQGSGFRRVHDNGVERNWR